MEWVATVGCEGGPVMAVDLPGFAQWTGAAPFTTLRELEGDRERFANRRNVLRFWGNLGGAGERFVPCADEAAATAELAKLRAKVEENCPGVVITEDEQQTHFFDPASKGQLWAELEPRSEYDASWQAHEEDEGWVHAYGKDARALFWDIRGGGVVDVGVAPSGDEVLLVRSWLSGERATEAAEEAAVRARACSSAGPEVHVGEIVVESGRLAVVWSPVAPFDLTGVDGSEAIAALGESGPPPRLATSLISGLGTVVRVEPGRYEASVATTADDGVERTWKARWCRLTRIA